MKMTPSDDNLFKKLEDDMETPGELTEEDKDLLKSLETMAAEIESEADHSS
jgi:hypothetical protein